MTAGKHAHIPRRQSARRRTKRRTCLILLGILLAALSLLYIVILGMDIVAAKRFLFQAKADVKTAVELAKYEEFSKSRKYFETAGSDFLKAREILERPSAEIASFAPFADQNISAVRKLASAGFEVAQAGRSLSLALECFSLSNDEPSFSPINGRINIKPFVAAQTFTKTANAHASVAMQEYDEIPQDYLLSTIKVAQQEFGKELRRLREVTIALNQVSDILPNTLGAKEKRRYFLAIQNNAELRATGGLIGCYGIMTIDNGKLSLDDFDKITVLQKKYQPVKAPTDFVDRYDRFKSTSVWSNANMSPDFPTVSRVLLGLYKSNTGQDLDGVISIDPVGLRYILEAIGPVWVPRVATNIDASNIIDWTLIKAYDKYEGQERRDFLVDVADAVWKKLLSAQITDRKRLLHQLSKAFDEKHMMLFSADKNEQKVFEDFGYAGALKPTTCDFLQVLMQNHGANKVDVYLQETIHYALTLNADGLAHVTATIEITNNTPKSGLPLIVAGGTPFGARKGYSTTYLSVYVPKNARLMDVTVDGKPGKPEVGYEKDKTVFSHYLSIAPGTSSVASFKYELPEALVFNGKKACYILDYQAQPLINPAHLTVNVIIPKDFDASKLPASAKKRGREISISKELLHDERFEIDLFGIRKY